MKRGSRPHRILTAVLVFSGRRSKTVRRWVMNRAWDDYHRKHNRKENF
jgi:hypothetical protein